MSTIAKVFVVLNFLLAAVFLGSAASILGHSDNWKRRFNEETAKQQAEITRLNGLITEKDGMIGTLQRDKGVAETERTKARQEADTLKTQNDSLRENFDKTVASLGNATRAVAIAQASAANERALIETVNKDRDQLQKDLAAANEQRLNAVRMQNQLEIDLTNIQQSTKTTEQKLAETAEALRAARFEVEAWNREHPGAGPGTIQPSQRAKVLTSDPATNIVVISLGSEDGVQKGYRFTVSRGSRFIGTIEITDVNAKLSAGKVVLAGGGPVMPNDDVASK
jgi:hypothetical protein